MEYGVGVPLDLINLPESTNNETEDDKSEMVHVDDSETQSVSAPLKASEIPDELTAVEDSKLAEVDDGVAQFVNSVPLNTSESSKTEHEAVDSKPEIENSVQTVDCKEQSSSEETEPQQKKKGLFKVPVVFFYYMYKPRFISQLVRH